jgi:uncharacterized protein (TIGR02271 family)
VIDRAQLREGMQVYSGEGQPLGSIERIDADSITVRGQQYEFSSVARAEGDRVYLTRQVGASADADRGPAAGGAAAPAEGVVRDEGQLRVPEVEERLEVETRPVELGEVRVRKTVEEEQQTVPVELTHEEVRVERREVRERPLGPGERAFEEGTIRVPVRGEEAVARKEAVVTGEVVIDKELTTERQEVTGTVRRTRVEVEEAYEKARPRLREHFEGLQGLRGQQPPPAGAFEQHEAHYRRGFEAAYDERYAGKRFEDVEPELRREYEASGGTDRWERLREGVRKGFDVGRER